MKLRDLIVEEAHVFAVGAALAAIVSPDFASAVAAAFAVGV